MPVKAGKQTENATNAGGTISKRMHFINTKTSFTAAYLPGDSSYIRLRTRKQKKKKTVNIAQNSVAINN